MSIVGFCTADDHLSAELDRADCLLRALVSLRTDGAAPDADPVRWGLSEVTPGEIAAYLTQPRPTDRPNFDTVPLAAKHIAEAAQKRRYIDDRLRASRPGLAFPLVQLVRRFGLTPSERDALLLLSLSERHDTYRRVIAYLHDNGARPWFSPQLLAQALGLSAPADILMPGYALMDQRLVRLEGDQAHLRLDWRVMSFLDGATAPHPSLCGSMIAPEHLAVPPRMASTLPMDALGQQLQDAGAITLNGPPGSYRAGIGLLAAEGAGLQSLCLPAETLHGDPASMVRLSEALREALLTGTVLVLLDADQLFEGPGNGARAVLAAHPGPLIVTGQVCPSLRAKGASVIEIPAPDTRARADMWRMVLKEHGLGERFADVLGSAFPVGPQKARQAAALATENARLKGQKPQLSDLTRACRSEAGTPGAHLTRFGQRIPRRPDASFDDLVLPQHQQRLIEGLRHRASVGRAVLEETGLARKSRLGCGCTALFVGASGTGKTMAAELMAEERGIELFKVNLAQLVSKWVGETEKHIAAVFAEARAIGAALFFDECDALFGKRGDVKEARDRWANLEVNHLLVELESHDGLVILATNLRRNIDDAFLRRIHAVIEFPPPGPECRHGIWRRVFPEPLVAPGDDDLKRLAEAFDLTGGQIRNIALDAVMRAHRAQRHGSDQPLQVDLRDIVLATGQEFDKLDRPLRKNLLPAEWCGWLRSDQHDVGA